MADPGEVVSGPALEVAPLLLGGVLRHRSTDGVVAVRISEVEAYSGDGSDPAAHTHRGPTLRNEVMYGPAGTLYVYFSYGMHWCANVVCGPPGIGEAVLLRAGAVIEGLELARVRRPAARRDLELARGPARLTQALGITGTHNGADLVAGDGSDLALQLLSRPLPVAKIRCGPRVGITKAADLPWRFFLDGDATVSRLRAPSRASRRIRP